jgi:hypothetical protein
LTLALNQRPRPSVFDQDTLRQSGGSDPSDDGFIPGGMIKNKKGQVNASDQDVPFEPEDELEEEPEELGIAPVSLSAITTGGKDLTVVGIQEEWDALTHAVSRERMSLATYLQEGVAHSWKDEKLVIGFSSENEFFKESLEMENNLLLVERIFSDHLKRKIVIRYQIVDNATPKTHEQDHPVIKDVLNTFGGEITSRWHNE